jgi:hypothetical protein
MGRRRWLRALLWGLGTEAGIVAAGALVGMVVYLPGPIDGWFYFSLMFFGFWAGVLGAPIGLVVGYRQFTQ